MCIQPKALALPILRISAPSFLSSFLAITASCFLCLLASMAGQAEKVERRSLDFTKQLPGLMGGMCFVCPWVCVASQLFQDAQLFQDGFGAFYSEAMIILGILSFPLGPVDFTRHLTPFYGLASAIWAPKHWRDITIFFSALLFDNG